jgi:hypothetical protein
MEHITKEFINTEFKSVNARVVVKLFMNGESNIVLYAKNNYKFTRYVVSAVINLKFQNQILDCESILHEKLYSKADYLFNKKKQNFKEISDVGVLHLDNLVLSNDTNIGGNNELTNLEKEIQDLSTETREMQIVLDKDDPELVQALQKLSILKSERDALISNLVRRTKLQNIDITCSLQVVKI